ncbi:hypothetical protein [Moorena sp. SIO1G6]|nr:hypothetical protein [Moorena sp. SIO1G6]
MGDLRQKARGKRQEAIAKRVLSDAVLKPSPSTPDSRLPTP